jgi:putative nucleotidyltransferase with HDIG domain
MNRSAYIYFSVVIAAAIGLSALAFWAIDGGVPHSHLLGVLAFVGLGILAEVLAMDVGPSRSASSSIGFIPLLACIIIFPLGIALCAAIAVHSFTQLVVRRRIPWKAAFNISQAALSIGVAAYTFQLLGGNSSVGSQTNLLAFFGLAISFFASNLILVSIAIALTQGQSIIRTARQAIGASGGNLVFDLLASPIALVVCVLYDVFYVGGIVLILLPLVLIRYSYLSKTQLQEANRNLLRVLIKAIETRDPYTSGHSLRVSTLAQAIAEDLGLSNRKIQQIETAALLHDIGKIDPIFASLISKPSDLTHEEREIIKTHAALGADLLRSLTSFDDELIRAVRHHHERFDGKGYPDGLVGTASPLAARIIMLCDSIDAMLSDRAYRRALSIEQTRRELVRCSGTQFDPEIVAVILRCNTLERAAALVVREPSTAPLATAAGSH